MGDDDEGWDSFEAAETRVDKTAVPEAAPASADATDRHKTLQGYVEQEIAVARARLDERRFWLTALMLAQMDGGAHVLVAKEIVNKLERWAAVPENARLIRVTMEDA